MTATRRFLFDLSFDEVNQSDVPAETESTADHEQPAAVEQDLPPPPPSRPLFTEDELKAEQQSAHEEGFRAGNEAAWSQFRQQSEQSAIRSLRTISQILTSMNETYKEKSETMHRQGVALAAKIVERMIPELQKRHGIDDVLVTINDGLKLAFDSPCIVITVSEHVAEDIVKWLAPVIEELDIKGRIQIRPEVVMVAGDVRIEWDKGVLERNSAQIWSEIKAIIQAKFDMQSFDTDDSASSPQETSHPQDNQAQDNQGHETEKANQDNQDNEAN